MLIENLENLTIFELTDLLLEIAEKLLSEELDSKSLDLAMEMMEMINQAAAVSDETDRLTQ